MPRIEEWAIIGDNDPYKAPEIRTFRLQGKVWDHPNPRHPDGKKITTSEVIYISEDGKSVVTKSKHAYHLGNASTHYIEWVEQNYPHLLSRWDKQSIIPHD